MQLTLDFTETETWKTIPGYEGIYEVSNSGHVRSLDRVVETSNGRRVSCRGVSISLATDKNGHKYFMAAKFGKKKTMYAHRAVMWAFVGPQPKGIVVCHNDGNPGNNRIENLRYDTQSENLRDRTTHGRCVNANKTHCKRGHEFTPGNIYWSRGGRSRACKTCHRERYMRITGKATETTATSALPAL